MPCSMPAFQRASGEVLLQKYKDYLARLMENAVMFETCLQASCCVVHQKCSGAACSTIVVTGSACKGRYRVSMMHQGFSTLHHRSE